MAQQFFLEGYLDSNDNLRRIELDELPFTIGRAATLSLCIPQTQVSRQHAQFFDDGGQVFIKDMGSTNGTLVNNQKIAEAVAIQHGDVVQIGSVELRVMEDKAEEEVMDGGVTMIQMAPVANRLPVGLKGLEEMIAQNAVRAEFQPIVLPSGGAFGYEILGRGNYGDLPVAPMPLFDIAESANLEVKLSEIFRDIGVAQAAAQSTIPRYFVNTHPKEMHDTDRLLNSMRALVERHPEVKLVMEIHEQAVTDIGEMHRVQDELQAMNVQLAYDDFGAGQARLVEMTEVPPDYVKFDMSLIRGIDKANQQKRDMVKSLVEMTQKIGTTTLAEGVGEPGELDVCAAMGFELIQGFHFGRPGSVIKV